jgi:hypothetical protein
MATDAALGFRAHSGWAAAVAVSGWPAAPVVVARRRLEIADPDDPDAKQPYHAAEPLAFAAAQWLVQGCTETSQRLARDAVGAMVADLRAAGHAVVGCGLLQGSGWPLPDLAGILASHALIHAAEGQMFREVLAAAGRHHELAVIEIREGELMTRCTHRSAPVVGTADADADRARPHARAAVAAGREVRDAGGDAGAGGAALKTADVLFALTRSPGNLQSAAFR